MSNPIIVFNPLEYVNFDSKVIDDVSFDGMSFVDFFATIRRLVLVSPTSMYYKIPSDSLIALKLLKTDEDLCSFENPCYENNLKIDLFREHNGYDIMEMIYKELHPKKHVESKFKAKKNTSYPSFNPDIPWNKCKPVLGMRDVGEGKCVAFKGKKPKTVNNEECVTSKHGSKKGNGRKVVNGIIRKVVKERWDKKDYEKKQNWCWFLSLLSDDLNLRDGGGIYMVSDGHKPVLSTDSVPDIFMPISRRDGVGYSLRGFSGLMLQHQ
ncbi:hypothetical protein Tco_1158209 [Tanacetum coccineum]